MVLYLPDLGGDLRAHRGEVVRSEPRLSGDAHEQRQRILKHARQHGRAESEAVPVRRRRDGAPESLHEVGQLQRREVPRPSNQKLLEQVRAPENPVRLVDKTSAKPQRDGDERKPPDPAADERPAARKTRA
jgi:hypothetical protein